MALERMEKEGREVGQKITGVKYLTSTTVEECQAKIRQLQQINNKKIVLQWIPGH